MNIDHIFAATADPFAIGFVSAPPQNKAALEISMTKFQKIAASATNFPKVKEFPVQEISKDTMLRLDQDIFNMQIITEQKRHDLEPVSYTSKDSRNRLYLEQCTPQRKDMPAANSFRSYA